MSDLLVPAKSLEIRHAVMPIRGLEIRSGQSTGDGSIVMRGHAAVTDTETLLYDVGWARMRETIAPGAFGDVLGRGPLVHLVHEHDMRTAMAATDVDGLGGLTLLEDDQGLLFDARVDPGIGFVADIARRMELGIIRQASFAFTIDASEYHTTVDAEGNEDTLRTIVLIGELYDVSLCAQGAYASTDAQLAARLARLEASDARVAPRAGVGTQVDAVATEGRSGGEAVAPSQVGSSDDPDEGVRPRSAVRRARARARARLAVSQLDEGDH